MTEKRTITFSPPDIREEDINEVVDTLRSGWITTGPKTKLFEEKIAAYCNVARAVTFSSATSAMEMTLRLLGVGPGDEVITSAYTYTASASVIAHVGAKIVLVDTEKESFNMDPAALEKAITQRTKVVIPVDIGGVMCDYDRIFEAVEKRKSSFQPGNPLQETFGRVIVLADAAHSLGSRYKGRRSGEVGDFTCYSFHAVKNLTTGEGGAATWHEIPGYSSDEIYNQFRLLSLHGQSKDALEKMQPGSWEYDIVAPYYKCNMMDVQAALGLSQLRRYDEILARRKELILQYDEKLKSLNITSLRHFTSEGLSSGHLYLVRLNGKDEVFRNKVIQELAERGISTNVHFKPLPLHTGYKNLGFDMADYPNAFAMYRNEVTLPLYNLLSNEDVDYIAESLKRILDEISGVKL